MSENIALQKKIVNATKWSFITEIMAKLINPITSMILARILTPNEFGVVATITMITSFADMIADSGFQKYIIQHDFKSDEDLQDCIDVAFWTNLMISIILWGIIIIFSEDIAIIVGNPGLGKVISIACVQIPITAFSSIQMSYCKRNFNYKDLFSTRIISIMIPFIVTIPFAMLGLSYWSLILGTIAGNISNACVLTIKSKYKPKTNYKISVLKEMFSFSIWSLIEAIFIWLTAWIDVFIIGTILNSHFLGLYKTSINSVNSIMSIVTVSTTSIIFSSLCRLQNDENEFQKMFFKAQKLVSMIIIPMGVGIYIYSDFVTDILLGSQWQQADKIIGIWALTSSIKMVLGDYCSEAFRAKGKPKLSLASQILHLIVLIPSCILSAKHGFWILVYVRSWIRIQQVVVQWIFMIKFIKIPIFKSFKNILNTIIGSVLMGIMALILRIQSRNYIWNFISIIICIIFYFYIMAILDINIKYKLKELWNIKIKKNRILN